MKNKPNKEFKYRKEQPKEQYFLGSFINKGSNMLMDSLGVDDKTASIISGILGTGTDVLTGNYLGAASNTLSTVNSALQEESPEIINPAHYKNGGNIKKVYNPNLAKYDKDFLNWYKKNTIEGLNNIEFSEDLDYDYFSFYKNNEHKNSEYNIKNHFPDTYKKTNHPTFSNESVYSTPSNPGGMWDNETFLEKGNFQYKNGGNMKKKYNIGGNLLTEFDSGGLHEENPLGGIPQGPNALVEEGETKFNDEFIFSDRLKINKELVEEFGLPKKLLNKTFAEASKYFNDEDRKHQGIDKKGNARMLERLAEAQEAFKAVEMPQEDTNQMSYGGKTKYTLGGDLELLHDAEELDTFDDNFIDLTQDVNLMLNNLNSTPFQKSNVSIPEQSIVTEKKNQLENLRYAPLAASAITTGMALMNKPDYLEASDYMINDFAQENLIDRNQIERGIDTIASSVRRNIMGASGGNAGAFMSNVSASGNQMASAKAGVMLNADIADAQEKARVEQMNLAIKGQSNQIRMTVDDINARERGAYRGNVSSAITNAGMNIGAVGNEELYKFLVQGMTDYDWRGKYKGSK